jgi:serine/threonine protein kinase
VVIVRKALRRASPDDSRRLLFDNEKRTLLLLNRRKHPNIVPFYGAYKYGPELCLLFPVLDMDLSDFFQRDSRYGDFQWDFTFFAALRGLSSALSYVHDVRLRPDVEGVDVSGIGYHHDLRPANILVTKRTFVLADFGLGRLKSVGQDSHTGWKAGAGDYIAPECMDENLVNQDVGRAIDVWAFGCLIAEVVTYMRSGSQALAHFCNARMSPGSLANWETSYFHNSQGHAKGSVRHWLDNLLLSGRPPSLDKWTHHLIFEILLPVPVRPKIPEVSLRLSLINVQAHYDAALEIFDKIVEDMPSHLKMFGSAMSIWFERERLKAFGSLLGPDGDKWNSQSLEVVHHEGDQYAIILKQLFEILRSLSYTITLASEHAESQTGNKALADPRTEKLVAAGQTHDNEITTFAADVQGCVQGLWDLLPRNQLRKIESRWIHAMRDLDKVDQLGGLEQALSAGEPAAYQEGAALVMMRQLRLELAGGSEHNSQNAEIELGQGDVQESVKVDGHQTGSYKSSIPVIIEWMYYDSSWQAIPPAERSISMSLKAQGFGVEPKPEALRTLHCLGFFERLIGQPTGYGFVYQIPRSRSMWEHESVPLVTLNSVLRRSTLVDNKTNHNLNQPLLGDKYHLSHALSEFVHQFHAIGWLHENLHSNNVVFFEHLPKGECVSASNSGIITSPYILGLHKCRPSGEKWHTQGPVVETDFPHYAHPDYEVTRHFRVGYDYYTLGVVLLEIGLWTPLIAWSGKHPTLSPRKLRDVLVQTYVPRLGPRMGSIYRDIVHKLLTDGLDRFSLQKQPDPENERQAFSRFLDEILGPLAEMSEMPV